MSEMVPRLRFKQDSGSAFPDWEKQQLGELFRFKVGGDVSKLNWSKVKTDTYRYPIFANADGDGLYGFADNFQYEAPAVTVTGRGNLGNAVLRTENFNAIVRLIVVELNDAFDGKFVEEAINYLNIFVESTGVPQLTAPQLSNYELKYPSVYEQQKIASFLSAVDEKIRHLERRLELLQTYKHGVMQKLFSQEVRFRREDGSSFPDWGYTNLGQLCRIQTGKKDVNQGNPKGVYPFFTCAKEPTFSDSYSYDTEAILIAGNGAVGTSHHFKGKFEAYQRTYILLNFDGEMDTHFIFHWIKFDFLRTVFGNKQESAMPYIKLGMLQNFKVPVPFQAEQQKIAAFFSALGTKLDAVNTQILRMQRFKKGLLQQMFV